MRAPLSGIRGPSSVVRGPLSVVRLPFVTLNEIQNYSRTDSGQRITVGSKMGRPKN